MQVVQSWDHAQRHTSFRKGSNQLKLDALHGVFELGGDRVETWIARGGMSRLQVAGTEAIIAYRGDSPCPDRCPK